MTSPGVKNFKIFEISAYSYNKSVLARKLEELERRGKKHSTALLILNVPDVIRFEVRSTVWPPEVMQGQNSRFSWKSFSAITRVPNMAEKHFTHHRVCLIKTRRMVYSLTSKGQI